jgi:ribose-phosphate pyrophosphokinase
MPAQPSLPIAVFAPAATVAFGAAVSSALGISLSPHKERLFTGGEYLMRSVESVRGRAVYAVQTLFGDPQGSANDRLCQLLFFIAALKDAGARHVTACIPYLAYARQDRHMEAGDPVTTRYVAQLFEAMRVDRVLALEVHNRAAFDNAFRCDIVHLDAAAAFAGYFAENSAGGDYAVASPDIGGVKRARLFQRLLQSSTGRPVNFAIMDKKRSQGVVSGTLFAGDVAGRRVIILDDLISSGSTVLRAVSACRRAGATRVDVAATHASFAAEAQRLFDDSNPDKPDSVIVTDSVPLGESFSAYRNRSLHVVSIASAFAEAIRELERTATPPEIAGLSE